MYISIAISSLLSKILDNVIIERQQDFLSTSNYQFGFKAKSSTVLCTTMVNETIQYYTEKGGRAVYLLLLDASKAFDKVSYEKLFELLLARNVCPKIVKLLYYMYTHQKCHVRWNNKQSDPFSVSNEVKQGSVISPLLFSIYIDNLFSKLKQLGLGCHVGLTYAGAFGGISKGPKADAVTKMPAPSNVSQLRSFLGSVQFYKFLPDLSTILEPLYHLTEKHTKWKWEEPQQDASQKLKQMLTNNTVLAHFDPSCPVGI